MNRTRYFPHFNVNQRKKIRTETTNWIVPVNPKYFDIEKAFAESDIIEWKQSNSVIVGDVVYLYLASPYSLRTISLQDDRGRYSLRVRRRKDTHENDYENSTFAYLQPIGIRTRNLKGTRNYYGARSERRSVRSAV